MADSAGVNSATVALAHSTQTVMINQRGDKRLPKVGEFDMSFRRVFKLQQNSIEPRIDIDNVTNASTVLGQVSQLGSAYGRASTIMRGRLIRLGANYTF